MNPYRGEVFPTSFSERVRKVSAPGIVNAVQMGLFGAALDYSLGLRRRLIESVITLGLSLDDY